MSKKLTKEQKQDKIADYNNQIAQLNSDLEQEIHLDKATIDAIKKKISVLEDKISDLSN